MEHIFKKKFLFYLLLVAFFMFININLLESQIFITHLNNKSEFDNLSGSPLSGKYGQVTAIKLIFSFKDDKLYFINSKYYKYHFEFCESELDYDYNLTNFNKVNYSDDSGRIYLIANINYFKDINKYALEIAPVDLMTVSQIIFLYNNVKDSTFIGEDLKFLLNSSRLQQNKEELIKSMEVIEPSDIYNNLNYQAISKYSGYGVLKFIDTLSKVKDELSSSDIIVLHENTLSLPEVAGIMINEFQTPLSHLSILGQNRKIPVAAYKPAFLDSTLRKYQNKKVRFTVLNDSFKIERAEEFDSGNVKPANIKLKFDLTEQQLKIITDFDKSSYKYAGNKAANLAILNKISKKADFKIPESAFVIPFFYYKEHILKSNASFLIDSLISNKANYSNKQSLRLFLRKIRDEIKNTPIDSNLLVDVENKISSLGTYKNMRFRSSTNAEDAEGFSGAGLYDSKTGILGSFDKPIDEAIKQVWASLWSYEAFLEREYYNINHREVFMAVLVHRSFPKEEVNGVAITKNLYSSGDYGFVINAQKGDVSVVEPKSGIISDQFICFPEISSATYLNKNSIEIITLSNIGNNKLAMTDSEIQHLANQLEIIKKYFFEISDTDKSYPDFGLDIEFKLYGKKRDLYIKQVRFYND